MFLNNFRIFILILLVFISCSGFVFAEDNLTVENTFHDDIQEINSDNSIYVNDSDMISSNDNKISDVKSFSDLNNLIVGSNSNVDLDCDYKFDSSLDSGAISISKNIVINGNGHVIDGNNAVSMFSISDVSVVLNNISFINYNNPLKFVRSNLTVSYCNFSNCKDGIFYFNYDNSLNLFANASNCIFSDLISSKSFSVVTSWAVKGTQGSSTIPFYFNDCLFENIKGQSQTTTSIINGNINYIISK